MQLVRDIPRHAFEVYRRAGVCRLRVYAEDAANVLVICTELEENDGMTVTNAAAELATQVRRMCGDPTNFTWVQQDGGYSIYPEQLSVVALNWDSSAKEYVGADWEPVTREYLLGRYGIIP